MFVMGDQNKMFGSLYDESDDRDAPIGSFKTLTNFVHSKTRSALQSRGGLIKDIDNFNAYLPTAPWATFPSQCHATKGNLSIHKIINGIKFRLKSYPDVDFTLMSVVCRYDQNIATGSAVDYAYVLKFFIYPFIPMDANMSGASIATASPTYEWRDITPYYVDAYDNSSVWSNTSGTIYEKTLTAGTFTVWPFSGDLVVSNHVYSNVTNRSIYIEKSGITTSPLTCSGKGFRFTGAILSKSVGKIYVDGFPAAVTAGGATTIRSNTLLGALDYNAFLMDPEDDPIINYEFLPDGNLVISVNSVSLNNMFELTFLNNHYFNKADSTSKPGDLYSKAFNNKKVSSTHYIADAKLCYGVSPFDWAHLALSSVNPTSFQLRSYLSGAGADYTGAATYTANFTARSDITIDPLLGTLGFADSKWAATPADGTFASRVYVMDDLFYGLHLMGIYCSVFSMHGRNNSFYTLNGAVKSSYLMAAIGTPSNMFFGYISAAEKNGITKPADEAVFTYGKFILIGMAKYSGYRYSMHSEMLGEITTPATYVFGALLSIPGTFDKRITGISVVMSDSKNAQSDFKSADSVAWKGVVNRDFIDSDTDQWDMVLKNIGESAWTLFVHNVIIGKNFYENADVGGNHLLQTGNPDYSRYYLGAQSDEDIVLSCKTPTDQSGSKLYKDFDFGPEDIAVTRDRIWGANSKIRSMQLGAYKNGNIMSDASPQVTLRDNAIVYSPIAEGGPTYHLFDFGSTSIFPSAMGDLVAISKIGLPQGLEQAVETERNNLLCLFRGGYQYWNLADNDPANWTDVRYDDDCCVSRDSVCESNGFVFCVGNTGVYMFLGTRKVDLTKLGGAKITKTWSAISTAYKEKTIGVFYPTEKWYIAIVPDMNKAYVFHLQGIFDQSNEPDKIGISEFEFAPHIGTKIVSACLHEGYIYVFCNDSTLPVLKYDPLSFGDYINDSITSGAIVKTMQPNYFAPAVRRTKMNNLQIDYTTSDPVTVELYADTRTINTVTLVSGEKLVNVNPKFNQSSRALRYSMKATVSGNRQTMINLLDFSVAEVVQKRLTRRDV